MHFFRAGMFFILSWKACNWVGFISVIAISVCSSLMRLWKVPLAFTWLLGMLTSSPKPASMWNVSAERYKYRMILILRSIKAQFVIALVTFLKFASIICTYSDLKNRKIKKREGIAENRWGWFTAMLTYICVLPVKWIGRLYQVCYK